MRQDAVFERSAKAPRCLVLLATRNGEAHIDRQLSSVLSQARVEVLVDVRDDGSKDATRDVVGRYCAAGEPVRLRADHAATGSAAGNFFKLMLGADATGFDYVAFSDQDDEWAADKLSRAVECLMSSECAGYSSGVSAVWPDGRTKSLIQSSSLRGADYLFEGAGQGCTFVLTSSLFVELQALLKQHQSLLAPIHYHDWTVYALTRTLGRPWYFDARLTMQYMQHAGNDTGARSSGAGVARRLALIREGWYRSQVKAMVDLVLAINPKDAGAAWWHSQGHKVGIGVRLAKLWFVLAKGRRRLSDRMVLAGAALGGYL